MRTVVTGGAGFIGSHLVKELLRNGYYVTVLDDFSTGDMDNLEPHPNLMIEVLDIAVDELPTIPFDTLFHLAAPVSVPESLENPKKYFKGIVVGSHRVMEWAYAMGAKRMIAASTAAIYGDTSTMPLREALRPRPMSPYADYKLEMEHMMDAYHRSEFQCSALRFFNVFGEGQRSTGGYRSAVPIFLEQFESFVPITVTGDGTQTRDWIYVKDVVNAMIMSIDEAPRTKMPIRNVGSGVETQVIEVAEAFGGEIVHIEKRDEPERSVASIDKITNELGWRPETNLLFWIKYIK